MEDGRERKREGERKTNGTDGIMRRKRKARKTCEPSKFLRILLSRILGDIRCFVLPTQLL